MHDGGATKPELRTCPRCREKVTPLRIVYGYPTGETFERAARGEIRLGGCVVGFEDPEFCCPACGAFLPWTADER